MAKARRCAPDNDAASAACPPPARRRQGKGQTTTSVDLPKKSPYSGQNASPSKAKKASQPAVAKSPIKTLHASVPFEFIAWECSSCKCTNPNLTHRDCVFCLTLLPKRFGIGGGPIVPGAGRTWMYPAAFPMDRPFGESKNNGAIKLPSPSARQQGKQGNLDTPLSDMTKCPSLPRQQEECKARECSRCIIENKILRLSLRCCINKIKQMSADVVTGYRKYYKKKYKKPLPTDVVVKIETLFCNCQVRRCAELLLTVEEEAGWIPDPDLSQELDLSNSSEESEEHTSDNVTFDSRENSEDENGDDNSNN
jgi:hypothetical protein